MSIEGTADLTISVLGGLVTNLAPADLPNGVSPDTADTQFIIGSVKTRPGVTALYTLAGNVTINSMATYETLTEIPRFVSCDSLGILRKDATPGGVLVPIYSGLLPGSSFRSCTLFGRQYFAFGAPIGLGNPQPFNGYDIPRQYDDTNFDRISQVGPGAAPTVIDEANVFALQAGPTGATQPGTQAIVAGPLGAIQNGNIVTITTTFAHGLVVGQNAVIAGVGVGGYNVPAPGVVVLSVPNAMSFTYALAASGLAASGGGTAQSCLATYVTTTPYAGGIVFPAGISVTIAGCGVGGYNVTLPIFQNGGPFAFQVNLPVAGLATSGSGTVTINGNVAAGKHQCTVIFVTRSSSYTKPAPPITWTAGGGKRAVAQNIPIGPPNVIARVLSFTAVNQASFYHLGPTGITLATSNMYIPDNTTTMLAVDFTDAVLMLGTLDDLLFNQIELPPVAGVIDYSNRLFAWGEQANLQSFLNLTFDGGFTNLTSAITGTPPNFPLGWTPDLTLSPGGGSANVGGTGVIFGDAYTITGDGATATRGKIAQGAAVDYLSDPILAPNTAYTVRTRLVVTGAAAGTAHVNLQSTSGGFTTVGISLAFNALTGTYALYSGNLTSGLATIPSDLVLQVYVDGTPTNNSVWQIENIEIFPTAAQFNNSNVRASKGQLDTQGQESFGSQTGLIRYNLNDGTSVRNIFKVRERLHIVKEHSFGVTQDDGVSEPSLWAVNDVSKKVGTPSVNGVGVGEDWVVIAHRTGLYLYWGGEPLKISEEIQPTWDTINWQYGCNICVTVDIKRRRIYICAPFTESPKPSKTLVLDYHDVGSDASAIAANPPIHLTYTGAKRAFDRSRKWSPWTIPASSVAQIEQANGTTQVYFGSNDNTGNINELDDTGTVLTDNGATIPSYYTTAFLPDKDAEEAKQLQAHRKLFSYLTTYSQGVGTVGITVYLASLLNAFALNPQTLSNPAVKDIEMTINQSTERMAVKLASSGNGQWLDFQKLVLSAKPEPWSVVRGA